MLGGHAKINANHWDVHWLEPLSIDVYLETLIVSCSGGVIKCEIRLEYIFNTLSMMKVILLPIFL